MKNKLFSEFKIKNFTLKNRLGLAPLTRTSSDSDSIPREDVTGLLINRAKSGVSVIYTEAIITDNESSQGYPGQSRLLENIQINAWSKVVDAIHDEGSIAIMQMFHCGRMSYVQVNPAGRVIAPSPIAPSQDNPLTGQPYPVPEEMTKVELTKVKKGFVQTALGAVKAGFDGIEIHCAHGYLLSQFLSSYSNKRDDEYGGSLDNRYRFISEVIEAVKDAIPEEKLLTVRISNWGVADMEVSLFKDKKEWQELISLFNKEPIDMISLSTYSYSNKEFGTDQNMAELTREVTEKPLMLCGMIYDRDSAEDALNFSDIILSGKSMLLNPHWFEDISDNKELKPFEYADADVAYTDTPLK